MNDETSRPDPSHDRAAIYDVMCRYFFFSDVYLHDAKMLAQIEAQCYTDDAVDAHGGEFGRIEGAEAVSAARAERYRALEGQQHFIGNHHIEVDGDEAVGYFYVNAWHWLAENSHLGPNRPADFLVLAACVNRFRRTPAGWRIAEERFHTFGPQGGAGIGTGSLPRFLVDGVGDAALRDAREWRPL